MPQPQTRLNATAALRMSDEEFKAHRDAEVSRRATFAGAYPDIASVIDKNIVSMLPSDVDAREVIIPSQGRNEEEDEKLAEVRKVHRRMAEAGVIPATIVSLLPWPVQATGVHLMYDDMTIPACPIGTAYVVKVISTYKVDIEDKGGRFGADVVTPIGMANDIIRQLQPQKRGGLFHYMGSHLPGENPKSRDKELKELEKVKKHMIAHFRLKYREAEGFYQQNSRRGLMNIVEEHRLCCQWLLHYRYLTQVPAWLTATREEADVPDACPKCGTEHGTGFGCAKCGYIFDPAAAYEAEEIDDEHQSLRRLTRDELDRMGLDYVMTKDEYRVARRKLATEEDDSDDEPTGSAPRRSKGRNKKPADKQPPTETKA